MRAYINTPLQILFLCLAFSAHAAIPLSGSTLRLEPTALREAGVAPKIIEVEQAEGGVRVKWFSLVKEAVPGQTYPTYKVRADRGVVEMAGLAGRAGFLHPHLWGRGFTVLQDRLPLWVDAALLELEGSASLPFDYGFSNLSPAMLQAAPDRFYEQLLYFQNLYEHYFNGNGLRDDESLTRDDVKALKEFREEFSKIRLIARTKARLVVNKSTQNVDARILGNKYFQMAVLDDASNPLVLSFRVLTDAVPRSFAPNFRFFKENFEFQVVQVSY